MDYCYFSIARKILKADGESCYQWAQGNRTWAGKNLFVVPLRPIENTTTLRRSFA